MPLKMIIQYAVNVIPDVKFVKQQDLTVLPAKMNIIISLGTNVYNVHHLEFLKKYLIGSPLV